MKPANDTRGRSPALRYLDEAWSRLDLGAVVSTRQDPAHWIRRATRSLAHHEPLSPGERARLAAACAEMEDALQSIKEA